jgi:glutamate 5-kinase
MESKCHIALAAAQAGIHVYIANGKREHVLTDLLLSPTTSLPFTHFLP